MDLRYICLDAPGELSLGDKDGISMLRLGELEVAVESFSIDERHVCLSIDGHHHRLLYYREKSHLFIAYKGRCWQFAPLDDEAAGGDDFNGGFNPELSSPMPGKVLEVLVEPGDEVDAEAPLLLLEAMKMETTIKAPAPARVLEICVEAGAMVGPGQLLVRLGEVEETGA